MTHERNQNVQFTRNLVNMYVPTRLRVEEEGEASDTEEILSWRKFEGFKEVGVLKDCIRGNHMDMGEFQKYLDQHCLGWVFNELFGIDRS